MSSQVSFNDGEAKVVCAKDETILFAGLRAGLGLPYECASGSCGSCRAKLVDGQVESNWPDATGLSDRDRRRGNRVLMCQSVPSGEAEVRVSAPTEQRDVREPVPRRLAGRLAERVPLTGDTARFVVELDGTLDYLPGQFVLLDFGGGVRRAYSMTHPYRGTRQRTLDLLIRSKPGGQASGWLFDGTGTGAELTVEGPYGKAYAQSQQDSPVLCLAGGTGLAPVLAIAEQLLEEGQKRPIRLYLGARTVPGFVLTDRLAELRASGVDLVASADEGGGADEVPHLHLGTVRDGLILDHLMNDMPDLSGHDVYLAGPPAMIDASMRWLVRESGASADRIFFDRFY